MASEVDRAQAGMKVRRRIAYDCRCFLGDRPCVWHKREGVLCECEHYEKVLGEILVIKLDAMGDVLRTTCLLPSLARTWPEHRISWITRPASIPLLKKNPYLDEIVVYGPDAMLHLQARRFKKVLNLDAGRTSASMAGVARAEEKIGFVLQEAGHVTATNPAAEDWLRLGVFDDLKKANRRSYQQIMFSILGLPEEGADYVMELSEHECRAGREHLGQVGVDLQREVIGIHTGGGDRWRLKQWHPERFSALIPELVRETGGEAQIVLFGGPSECAINQRILDSLQVPVFDAGCENPVRHFAALIRCCSVVLSGDSLAMHVALAMKRRVVVLFGPTSHAEIELFGRGEKVIPDLDCLVCYKTDCDFVPNCMDSISVQMVKKAVLRQLEQARVSRQDAKVAK